MSNHSDADILGPELCVTEALACLRRRWIFMAACAIVAATVAGLASMTLLPRQYAARTTLLANIQAGGTGAGVAAAQQMLGSLTGQMGMQMFDSVGYAYALLNSRMIRDTIVQELHLQTHFGVDTAWEAREALGERTRLQEDARQRTLSITVTIKGTPWIKDRSPSADHEMRTLAADIANAYYEQLREESTRLFRADVRTRRDFVAQRLKEAQEALAESEEILRQWQEGHQVVAPTAAATEMTKRLVDLRVQQEQLRVQAAAAAGQVRGAREQMSRTDELRLASATDVRNPRIDDLQKKLTEAETALALAVHGEGASENHPEVRRHRISIQTLTEELQQALEDELVTQQRTVSASPVHDEVNKQLLQAQLQKLSADAQSVALDRALARVTAYISQMPEEQTEFARKSRDVTVKEQVYQMLRMEYERALIDEHRVIDAFAVLDAAIPPERKSGPKIMANTVVAGIAGLLFSVLWVLMALAMSAERKQ